MKEIERYERKSSLQNDETNTLKKLANVPFNDKLVRKVARKELEKEQNQ